MGRPRLSLEEKSVRRAFRRHKERNKATPALAQHFDKPSKRGIYRRHIFRNLRPERLITKDGEDFIESDDLNLKEFLEGLEKAGADIGFIEFLASRCSAVAVMKDCMQRFHKTRGRGQPIEREKIEAMFIFKNYFELLTGRPHWDLISGILNRISHNKTYQAKDIISWFNKRNLIFKDRNGMEEIKRLQDIYNILSVRF